jgi:hypothetical protein
MIVPYVTRRSRICFLERLFFEVINSKKVKNICFLYLFDNYKRSRVVYRPIIVCELFSRALYRCGAMRYGRRTQRSLLSVHLFSTGSDSPFRPIGCIFRGFSVIVSLYRFRWAQTLTVNYPGLLISRHLWISKGETNIIAKL